MNPSIPARLFFFLLTLGTLEAYDPPLGIPDPADQHPTTLTPGFGWEIDRATPAQPASWTQPTPSATANYYYIDSTAANDTDTANPYGHPGLPRTTIPEGLLAEGAFIYVHAGSYVGAGDRFDWHGTGTSANPIWITGNSTTRPILAEQIQIGQNGSAAFFVLENFEVNTSAGILIRPGGAVDASNTNTVTHVLVRNILKQGTSSSADAGGAIIIGYGQSNEDYLSTATNDVVIYNCVLRNQGDKTISDEHGVSGGYPCNRVWVLDNEIYNVGGDSFQASHYSRYTDKQARNYYVGRNTMYGNGENGIDIKTVQGFVISQNTIYGPFTREQGWGIVIHGGFNPSSFHAKDGAVIFNNVYNCAGGIYTSFSSGVDNIDIIGNRIWNIKASHSAVVDSINGACVLVGGSTPGSNSVIRVVDNTFHDYDRGLYIRINDGDSLKVHGNIFSSKANPSLHELEIQSSTTLTAMAGATLNYNLYTGTPSFLWRDAGGLVSRTLAYMQGTPGQEALAVSVASMSFVNAATGNFSLVSGSPAIDVSVEGPAGDSAYTAFQTRVGAAIRRDIDNRVRPVDGVWDIGAYESALVPNAAPSGLQIVP